MRSSSIRRFVFLAGVATAFSGCGAESGLSSAELAQRANAICARYKPLYHAGANAQTRSATVRYLDRTMPASAREERELRALRPRRNVAPKVRRLLDHVREAIDLEAQLRNATAAHDDTSAIKVGRRVAALTRRTTKEARALGWTICASDPR
jgi:hypothetical protein